jgi:hypothetical protein
LDNPEAIRTVVHKTNDTILGITHKGSMTYKFKDDMSYSVCFEAGKVIGETKIHLRFEEQEN